MHRAITDRMLLDAIRRKAMRDLEERQAASVVNNVYGGGGTGGVMENMGGRDEGQDPGDFDYMVDISRENMEPGDADPSDPERKFLREGWHKRVHRFRTPKKKVMGRE